MMLFLKNDRGIALILTILIVSLIVVLTLQFNTTMRSHLHAAENLSDGIKLRCIARSGFNGARAILYEDALSGNIDTLYEPWALAELFSEGSASLFEEGRLSVGIADLSGKIQINQLVNEGGTYNTIQKELLMRFLGSPEFGLPSEEMETIVDAIKDWIDTDSETTRFGAENAYYETLERPYPCKNAPLEFPEELLLVRGITAELFYGSGEKPGIFQYISVYGDGKININTANSLVIRALSENIDKDVAEDMISYRENEDNDLSDFTWYKKGTGMADVSIPDSLLTTSSTYFEITSEGFKGTMSKRIKGVVERKDGKLQILSWKVG
ncbi:MAG: type II secretion system minor pseudopilin GspK [Pseudomonadota bacterium]